MNVTGVAAIIIRDGWMLIGRKDWKSIRPMAGQWMLPGGRIDSNDKDPYECLIRELKEETGLEIYDESYVQLISDYEHRNTYTGDTIRVHYYLVEEPVGDAIAGDDLVELKWIKPELARQELGEWSLSNTPEDVWVQVETYM